MKHKLFWILAVILVSCKEPVIIIQPEEIPPVVIVTPTVEPVPETPPVVVETPAIEPATETPAVVVMPIPNVRIYNSAWDIVQEGYVENSRSVTTTQSYEDYVSEYNMATNDDQLFLIEGEGIVMAKDAPNVNAYIVNPVTHEIIKEYLNWPREDLKDRRKEWRLQAEADGGVLFVDKIPPAPVVIVDTRPAFEKYALYLIYTGTGIIKYEEHLTTEAEFLDRRAVYLIQEAADGGLTYVVSGKLYP